MKRYFSISLTGFIFSILNVASFILLGVITKNTAYSEIFSLTYPLQFVVPILLCFFCSASCIRANKENNKNCIDTGIILGLIAGVIIFGFIEIFVDRFILFMNMSPEIYHNFTIMAIGQIFFTFVICMLTDKMYFLGFDRKANLCKLGFIVLNLLTIVVSALATSEQIVIVLVNLISLFVYCAVLFGLTIKKFKFDFNILTNIKYESADIVSQILMLIIYLFGFSRAFSFGAEYVVAINFVNLVTDPQWDALGSVSTIAKIDISKNQYNFRRALKYSSIITVFYMATSLILFFALFKTYQVALLLGLIFIAFQFFDMLVLSFVYNNIKVFIQLQYSPTKCTLINLLNHAIRTVLAIVILSPFNTVIAQIVCGIVTLPILLILLFKNFKVSHDGFLVAKNNKDNLKTTEPEN